MGTIFISHSSMDNDLAEDIVARLKQAGHTSVFLDFHPEDGIPPGRNWEQELYRRLRMCRAVIVLCTEHSMSSKWCFAEIAHARALGKPVIPLRADECEIDDLLKDRQILDLALDAEEAFGRLLKALEERGLDPSDSFTWDPSRPPYPGLLPFQESEAATFFGREDAIRDGLAAINRLRNLVGANLLLVLGASGSGKSSLVRAGLLPRLRRDHEHWIVINPIRPLGDILGELAAALAASFEAVGEKGRGDSILSSLRDAAAGETASRVQLLADFGRFLRLASYAPDARIVLVVDQVEELLIGGSTDPGGAKLFRTLCESGAFLVVATLRSDFFGEFQGHDALRGLDFETLPLGPLAASDLRQVIAGPAAMAGLEMESALVDTLVEDAGHFDALPLLAFTLRELWERRDLSGSISLNAYRNGLGGLSGAVAQRAEETLTSASASPEQVEALHLAMLQMVRVNEEGEYARKVLRWEDAPPAAHALLERFVQERLLVSSGDGVSAVVEVAHEALFRAWARLAAWLAENIELLRARTRVDAAGARWAEEKEHDDFLLAQGRPLLEGQQLLQATAVGLGAEGRRFVKRSVEVRRVEEQKQQMADLRRRRRGRQLLLSVSLLMIVGTLAAYAFLKGGAAERALGQAEVARGEADAALKGAEFARERTETARIAYESLAVQALADGGSYEALAYALEAVVRERSLGQQPPAVAHRALSEAVSAMYSCQPLLVNYNDSALFSPDGQRILANIDGDVVLLDSPSGQVVQRFADEGADWLENYSFSADGSRVLAGYEGGVFIWNAISGVLQTTFIVPGFDVAGAQFSARASKVLVSFDVTGCCVFDAESGDLISLFGNPDDEMFLDGGFFSSDGEKIITENSDGDYHGYEVRSTSTGSLLSELNSNQFLEAQRGRFSDVYFVGCSFDGDYLAAEASTPEDEEFVLIVEMVSGQIILEQQGSIFFSFSPDSRSVLLSPYPEMETSVLHLPTDYSDEGPAFGEMEESLFVGSKLSLWSIHEGEVAWETQAFPDISFAGFSPDGKVVRIFSKGILFSIDSEDGQISITREFDHTQKLEDIAVSPTGNQILASDYFGMAALHRVGDWARFTSFPAVDDDRNGAVPYRLTFDWSKEVVFLPKDSMAIALTAKERIQSWDAQTGEVLTVFETPNGKVAKITASPNGKYLVGVSDSKEVAVWRISSGELIFDFVSVFPHGVFQADFSPDGEGLLLISIDGSSEIWDIESGAVRMKRAPSISESHYFSVDEDRAFEILGWPLWSRCRSRLNIGGDEPSEFFYLSLENDRQRRVASLFGTGLSVDKPREGWNPDEYVRYADFLAIASVATVAFSPHGDRVFSSLWDGTAEVWDSATGKNSVALGSRGGPIVAQAVFAPDGLSLFAAYVNGEIKRWDVNSGALLQLYRGHTSAISEISLSENGNKLVSASGSYTARIWNVETGESLAQLKHQAGVLRVVFSPDGSTILSSDSSGLLRVWDATSGTELLLRSGSLGSVGSQVFSTDGARALILNRGQAQIWNTSPDIVIDWGWRLLVDSTYLSERSRQWLEENTEDPPASWPESLSGESPFHYVAMTGSLLAAKGLFDTEVSCKLPGFRGRRPLHVAAIHGNLEVAKLLLENGALPFEQDLDGNTPLSLARQHGHQGLVDLLEPVQEAAK